jgi:hypothetical protein
METVLVFVASLLRMVALMLQDTSGEDRPCSNTASNKAQSTNQPM